MSAPIVTTRAWLVAEDGTRRRIGPGPLLIGRGPDCDVVLDDPRVSKRHLLLRPGQTGVELHVLGRNLTEVGGEAVPSHTVLRDGDRIDVPAAHFTVSIPERGGQVGIDSRWVLVAGSVQHAVRRGPFVLGSGEGADLRLPCGPAHAGTLRVVQGALVVEEADPTLLRNGEPVSEDDVVPLDEGDVLDAAGCSVVVARVGAERPDPTTVGEQGPLLRAARFSYLPSGGDLSLEYGDRAYACRLPELRARLVALLLQPPAGYAVGQFLPDDVILPRIWPNQPERTHMDMNTLVHRLRKDLLRVGIDPTALVERARTGGATRLRIDRQTAISVE